MSASPSTLSLNCTKNTQQIHIAFLYYGTAQVQDNITMQYGNILGASCLDEHLRHVCGMVQRTWMLIKLAVQPYQEVL